MILVVGATGQVGSAVVKAQGDRGVTVRALARIGSNCRHLQRCGAEIVVADLMDRSSLDSACAGIRTVIATATAHIPRRSTDDFRTIDDVGYRNLIESCKRSGVERVVFCSVLPTPHDKWIPLCRLKRAAEATISASGLDYAIVRCPAFMDVAFVTMGSTLPILGADAPTVRRPYRFVERHIACVQDSIEKDRVAHVPGQGSTKHSFICVRDVAEFLIAAAASAATGGTTLEIGGPQQLCWLDVVGIYEDLLGLSLRVKRTPAFVFRSLSRLFSPFSAPASNIMAINYMLASTDATVPDAMSIASGYGVRLTSARQFLERKLELRQAGVRF